MCKSTLENDMLLIEQIFQPSIAILRVFLIVHVCKHEVCLD